MSTVLSFSNVVWFHETPLPRFELSCCICALSKSQGHSFLRFSLKTSLKSTPVPSSSRSFGKRTVNRESEPQDEEKEALSLLRRKS